MKRDTTWLLLRHHTSSLAGYDIARQRRQVLIANFPSKSVCLSIAWALVMFSLLRETWDCCANQQCNVSVEK